MADLYLELTLGTESSLAPAYYSPFNTYYHDQRLQYIVLASELQSLGLTPLAKLKGLALKPAAMPGMTSLTNVRIRMRHTTQTTSSAYVTDGWTTVFGPTTVSTAGFSIGNWGELAFSAPFIWDGTSNLLIDITRDGTTYSGSSGGHYIRTIAANRSICGNSDSNYTWPFDTMTNGGAQSHIPSTRFRYEPGIDPPTVANLAASGITFSGATIGGSISATGGENPTRYLYWGETDGGTTPGNWANVVNLGSGGTGDFTTVLGLTPGKTYYFRAYASNSAGGTWAASSLSFTTPVSVIPTVKINNSTAELLEVTSPSLRIDFTGGSYISAVTIKTSYQDPAASPDATVYDVNVYDANPYAGDDTVVTNSYAFETTIFYTLPNLATVFTLEIAISRADGGADVRIYRVLNLMDTSPPLIQSIEIAPDPATAGATLLIKVRVVD